jgi:serine/threonine protein kinase/WD40 repeat protein
VIGNQLEQLSLEDLEYIDGVCDAFAKAKRDGQSPYLEDWINSAPTHLQMFLAIELIDLELALCKDEEQPETIKKYVGRFPHWSQEISERLAQLAVSRTQSNTLLQVQGYEILGELGRGGMGVVYQARQTSLGRIVALKMATLGHSESQAAREGERFRIEAEAAASLQHPHIVQIYQIGQVDGIPYYTMEFVDGGNLSQHIASAPMLPVDAAQLVQLLAQAVSYAHEKGIIHRDLKPSNVLLQFSGATSPSDVISTGKGMAASTRHDKGHASVDNSTRMAKGRSSVKVARLSTTRGLGALSRIATDGGLFPKLTDFGLAKQLNIDRGQTQTGMIMGTPSYMAPEQASGQTKNIGPAVDIYALGTILYETLVGHPPFRAATMLETLDLVRYQEAVPPRRLQPLVPPDLETICLKCLEKRPETRYESASALADDLARFIAGRAIEARPIGHGERAWRWAKHRPEVAAMLVAVVSLLVALTVIPSLLAVRLARAREQADQHAQAAVESQRKAEVHAQAAEAARAQAVSLAMQSQNRLVGTRIANGVNHASLANFSRSLLWHSQAWLDDIYHSRNEQQHRLRIGYAAAQVPELFGLCIHSQPIIEAVLDKSHTRILLRDDSSVAHLWNPLAGKPIGQFDHGTPIARAIFSPNADMVLTAGENVIKLWDTDSQTLLGQLQESNTIVWADLNPCGSHLVTALSNGQVTVWDVERRQPQINNLACESSAMYAGFSPDGSTLIAIDSIDQLTAWRFSDGELLAKDITHDLFPKKDLLSLPQFIRHGTRLVTYSRSQLEVWDTITWQRLSNRVMNAPILDVAFSENGDHAVLSNGKSQAQLLDIPQPYPETIGSATPKIAVAPRQTERCAISANGQLAAISSSGGLIEIWGVSENRVVHAMRTLARQNQVQFVQSSEGDVCLLSVGDDCVARIWRMPSNEVSWKPYDFTSGQSHSAGWIHGDGSRWIYSPDGKLEFHIVGSIGTVRARDHEQHSNLEVQHQNAIVQACFSDDGRRLMAADEYECKFLDTETGDSLGCSLKGSVALKRIGLSADGSRALAWRSDNSALIWDVDAERVLLETHGGTDSQQAGASNDFANSSLNKTIEQLAISPDGNFVVQRIGLEERTAAYRVSDGKQVLLTDYQKGIAAEIAFSMDGCRFLVANSDTRARVWDLVREQPTGPFLNHPTFVRQGCLNHDGTMAATYAADRTLRVWNVENGDLLVTINVGFTGITFWFSDDSKRVIVRKQDGDIIEPQLTKLSLSSEYLRPYTELLCGERIDQTDGIAVLDVNHFRDNPSQFLNAWRASREGARSQFPER